MKLVIQIMIIFFIIQASEQNKDITMLLILFIATFLVNDRDDHR